MSGDPTALARRFPPGFLFGTATAAYQIEGGHDADGKGPSIWDAFCRQPGAISTGETGDLACDHYHRWREDVALLRDLGCNAYRLSISWPRVMPEGSGAVNEPGLAFYDRLIDELLKNGIRPFVTLYHWDLPQALQKSGGWSAPETVAAFGRYADVVARRLGDRVRDWMTLNEPEVVAFAGHYVGVHAPGIRDFKTAVGVSHHLLLAHRAAADAIRAAHQDARVGIALNLSRAIPRAMLRPTATRPRGWMVTSTAGSWIRCSDAATRRTCSSCTDRTSIGAMSSIATTARSISSA